MRAPRPAAPRAPASLPATIRCNGGSTFAEHPEIAAPDARIIWHAALDPGTLRVLAVPAAPADPEGIDPAGMAAWLALSVDAAGREHAVLSDGRHHIRLDVEAGTLAHGPVVLHYRVHGVASAARAILPLRRLLHLVRHRGFPSALFPIDQRIARGVELLRVSDALGDHASQREIACALFGREAVVRHERRGSDALRSRVRRLVKDARALASGGYRSLLGGARTNRDDG